MKNNNEHLIREIQKLQNSVRRKLREIKSSSIQTQRSLETQYQPLIEPLKLIANEQKTIKKEIIEEPEMAEMMTEEPIISRPSIQFDEFIQDNNIGDMLSRYLQFIQTDDKEEADFTYGIHYDGDEWKMGTSPVSFSDNDITVNGVTYKGTPGLFELIFKKHPEGGFDDNDLKNYKKLLQSTGVHKREDGRGVKANRGYKYTNIISNMFPPKSKLRQVRSESSLKRPTQPLSPFIEEKRKKVGEGLLMAVNKNKIDYRYWDDPNELVDRLRLLIASKEAGNTGHDNEIIAILEELKEARIIKSYNEFKL